MNPCSNLCQLRMAMKRFWTSTAAIVALGLFVLPARAVNPALSGSLTVPFLFQPDDPNVSGDSSFWYWSGGIPGSLSLSVPSVMEITTSVLGNVNWSNPNNWNKFPLDTGGLSIGTSGSGTWNVSLNGGSPYLDVLGLAGPYEGTVQTHIDFTNIHGSGSVDGFASATLSSNTVATKYNATIPSSAHMNMDQIPTLQNLTINSGATINNGGFSITIRDSFVNHGGGDFNAVVGGNFTNDALAASGNVANSTFLDVGGQLNNTGELNVSNYLKTHVATGNAGTIKINGGEFNAGAAFANSGTIQFTAGSINGPGVITNNGTFQWTGQGNINPGAEIVNATSAFTISSPNTGTKFLGGTLTNNGTITESGATALEISGGTINNQIGALYDITDDSHVSFEFSGTTNNAGTFRKSGGSGDSIVGTAFNNTGTLTVTSGKLRFRGGGTLNGGTMTFSGGHEAEIYAGNFSVIGTNSASGNGALEISAGDVFVNTGVSSSFANFTNGANLLLTGGIVEAKTGGTLTFNLTGSSTVQLAGPANAAGGSVGGLGSTINTGNFQWVHGNVVGNFTNASNSFTIVAGNQLVGQNGQFTNANTISQGDGSILGMLQGGSITNNAGALWAMSGTSVVENEFQAGAVNNAGIWRKSGASTTSSLHSISFNNTGTLAIESGKLYIIGPNTLNLLPAGTLSFKLSGLTSQVDFGKLEGTNTLNAGGKFSVSLAPGFAPALGNSFDLIDWCSTCSLDGTFSTLALPPLASGLKWDSSQLYTDGVLTVGAGIPGDFNQNGVVDAPDYVLWRKLLGTTYTAADYNDWRLHFGQTNLPGFGSGAGAVASQAAVPEPSAILFGLMALAATTLRCNSPRRIRAKAR